MSEISLIGDAPPNTDGAILVTGAAGYLGSHAVAGLTRAGYRVVGVDNYLTSNPRVADALEELLGDRPVIHDVDVADESALRAVFSAERIGAVLHFAGLKSVGDSMADPLLYYRVNLQSATTLLMLMRDHGVRQIIFSSSCTVYGNPPTVPVDETAPIAPISPYGETKATIEALLQDLARSEPGWSALALRYFNPVGADPSGLIGEDPAAKPTTLLPNVMAAATGDRPVVRVFGDDHPTPDGTCIRDFIHVSDLIDAHIAALRCLPRVSGFEAMNVGTGHGISVLEMIEACSAAAGSAIPFEMAERRPGDASVVYARAGRANDFLGWHPKRTLSDMACDHWRWHQSHPHGYQSDVATPSV